MLYQSTLKMNEEEQKKMDYGYVQDKGVIQTEISTSRYEKSRRPEKDINTCVGRDENEKRAVSDRSMYISAADRRAMNNGQFAMYHDKMHHMAMMRRREAAISNGFCSADEKVRFGANRNSFVRPEYMHRSDLHRFERDVHIRPSNSSMPRAVPLGRPNELSVTENNLKEAAQALLMLRHHRNK